jgi:hypothetical protein
MNVVNKFDATWMDDESRRFHDYFIILITNTSSFFCFLPYATTSPTTLANMQAFFPVADPTNSSFGFGIGHFVYPSHFSSFFLLVF